MKITISGVECEIGSSVHQSTGYIFLTKQVADYEFIEATTFSLEKADKVRSFLENVGNFSVSVASPTKYIGYGHRVTMMSIPVSSQTINDMFSKYLLEKMKL